MPVFCINKSLGEDGLECLQKDDVIQGKIACNKGLNGYLRGGVKKSGTFGWWGVRGPATTFGQKSTTFYFCFHSMQKPSKRVKTQ